MRSRQLVCNDPRVIRALERFIPVVDNPGRYHPRDSGSLEYQLAERVLGQTVYGRISGAQGLYVISPAGQLLAGTTEHSNPDRVLAEMQRGLDAYARLPRAQRLLPREPNPAVDCLRASGDHLRAPDGGLVLRMVTRGLSPEVPRSDTRHPSFYKLDRVWLTREQARAFLPPTLRVGERISVRGPGLALLLRLHLGVFVQPNIPWSGEDVQQAQLSSEVTAIDGASVTVQFTGSARYAADTPFNNRRYEPRLLGRAVFNSRNQKFERFELIGVGPHTLGTIRDDARTPGPRTISLGVLFTLNPANANDQAPPEHLGQYAWVSQTAL